MARRRKPPSPSPGPVKPFDVILKSLIFQNPEPWLRWAGLEPADAVQVIDTDLSTIPAESDKIVAIGDPPQRLGHFELTASYSTDLPLRLNRYNILAEYKHGLPVWSTLVLLRPLADGPAITGSRVSEYPRRGVVSIFHYGVIRVWEHPYQEYLQGGLATLSLAPLGAGAEVDLPQIIREIDRVLSTLPDRSQANEAWACITMLMGLQYEGSRISDLMQGIFPMKESSLYQYAVAEGEKKGLAEGEKKGLAEGEKKGLAEGEKKGRLDEARRLFLRLQERRLQTHAPESVKRLLDRFKDPSQVEELVDRLGELSDWDQVENAARRLLTGK